MLKTLILATVVAASIAAASDLPPGKPVSATEITVCFRAEPVILVMVVTYADGTVVRFDAQHMHGLSVQQMLNYASQAQDTFTEGEKGCGITT